MLALFTEDSVITLLPSVAFQTRKSMPKLRFSDRLNWLSEDYPLADAVVSPNPRPGPKYGLIDSCIGLTG